MKKIAVSVGDINGVGLEILLRSHRHIASLCDPVYCVDREILEEAAQLLNLSLPEDIATMALKIPTSIEPKKVTASSGAYSFASFQKAVTLTQNGETDAVVTLPIHKEAWSLAGIPYKGHTDYLRHHFKKDAIMMLGCDDLYVALFTEHIPLKKVIPSLTAKALTQFLLDLYRSTLFNKMAVLGVNPHAGDNGVLGDEERFITEAIFQANKKIGTDIFFGPVVPDTAFTPHALQHCNRIVAIYHDQGLAPLKALYFDQSINVSLNLPIIRTSVDHGTAFDIAYSHTGVKTESYLNAVKVAVQN